MSQIYFIGVTLYMFRTVFPSIIRRKFETLMHLVGFTIEISMAYIKPLTFLTYKIRYKILYSQLFEGTAFHLTFCCRLYVLLFPFENNI